MKYESLLILIIIFLLPVSLFSQKEFHNWYFGDSAGVTFIGYKPPSFLFGGGIYQQEGCATISDAKGNLLFYTDGQRVWNMNHQIMPNGDSLAGDFSSAQSALIVPKPGSKNIYYIFTTDKNGGNKGLCYSVVDISLQNGYGDVLQNEKNKNLLIRSNEKLSAVLHPDGKDIWVVGHKYNTNSFYAWLVTDQGISKPVITQIGDKYYSGERPSDGYLKFSGDGKFLASAVKDLDMIDIFKFNGLTGEIYDRICIKDDKQIGAPYGVEFSTQNVLYVTCINPLRDKPQLLQFDLSQYDLNSVLSSMVQIHEGDPPEGYSSEYMFAMQIGPDDKIYVIEGDLYLGVINNPNALDYACSYDEFGFKLLKGRSKLGLPNCISGYSKLRLDLSANELICKGDTIKLHAKAIALSSNGAHYSWLGPDSFKSALPDPVIANADGNKAGFYICTVSLNGYEKKDSIYIYVLSGVDPKITTPNNQRTICDGEELLLSAELSPKSYNYKWSTGDTTSIIKIKKPGKYYVTVSVPNSSRGCTGSDTIEIGKSPALDVKIKGKTSFCKGDETILSTDNEFSYYHWSTGDTSRTIKVKKPGKYFLTVRSNSLCTGTDSVLVTEYPVTLVKIDGVHAICKEEEGFLRTDKDYSSIIWSTGESTKEIRIIDTGDYSVTVIDTNGCSCSTSCHVTETVVNIEQLENMDFGSICIADSLVKDFNIHNMGSSDIIIGSIGFINTPPVKIESYQERVDTNQIVTIPLKFTPGYAGPFDDSIIVTISAPCKRIYKARIKGESFIKILARLPIDTVLRIKDSIAIPFDLNYTCGASLPANAKFSADISFDASAFLPYENQDYGIVNKGIINGERIMNIAGSGMDRKYIKGEVFLADKDTIPLRITNFQWDNNYVESDIKNGSLIITGLCKYSYSRIQMTDHAMISITPNPAGDRAAIILEGVPNDNYIVNIYSIEGIKKEVLYINKSSYHSELNLDLKNYSNGIYEIVVTNGKEVIVGKIAVNK